jgi:hypothetical protein
MVSHHKSDCYANLVCICVVFFFINCIGIACHYSGPSSRKTDTVIPAKPVLLAHLEDRSIDESSGIIASRRNPGLYWTHNDSGDLPLIFAFDRTGRSRGVWSVSGADAYDWEDIAYGPGPEPDRHYLYIGDIGDNKYSREEIVIYRFLEPLVEMDDARPDRNNPHQTDPAEAIRLKYPDGPHDAEALMVHPLTAEVYIVTKETSSGVYKLKVPLSVSQLNLMARIADLQISKVFDNLITGGDISPDGQQVALSDYAQGYELRLSDSSDAFDSIWGRPYCHSSWKTASGRFRLLPSARVSFARHQRRLICCSLRSVNSGLIDL